MPTTETSALAAREKLSPALASWAEGSGDELRTLIVRLRSSAEGETVRSALRRLGIELDSEGAEVVTAAVPRSSVLALAALPFVRAVEAPRRMRLLAR